MSTRTLESLDLVLDHPDVVGRRVLVTGVSGALGIEVARLFAEHRVRLVVQSSEDGPEVRGLADDAARTALDVRVFAGRLANPEEMLTFARSAVQSFGGLDTIVNVAHLGEPADGSQAAVERAISDLLALPCLVTRVAANRMRMTMIEGTILNIVAAPATASARGRIVAGMARSALAALTRGEAATWSPHGIRVNGIAPASGAGGGTGCLSGAPDVATLALHLASERGGQLSGLVFDAWCG